MELIEINDNMLAALHLQAEASERKRMNYDLRTTSEDGSQRMLNALEVGTKVPIHRHLETIGDYNMLARLFGRGVL